VPDWLWSVVSFVGLAAIIGMDRVTTDAGAGAQLVLLFPADSALYLARHQGRDRVVVPSGVPSGVPRPTAGTGGVS
jgi:hypothetical protein